jgi:hypothetical protein
MQPSLHNAALNVGWRWATLYYLSDFKYILSNFCSPFSIVKYQNVKVCRK